MEDSTRNIVVEGGVRLCGTVFIQGAKNAVLPMIAASLMIPKGKSVIRNVPQIEDVIVSITIAERLGAKIDNYADENTVVIDASEVTGVSLDKALTQMSRGSILFMPPILHRNGSVEFSGFGGRGLGGREVEFHYNGLKRMGADVEVGENVRICMDKSEGLRGNLVYLDIPSQTSTENLMMAGVVAKGRTIIENASSEPEVLDFAKFLVKAGAHISGVGTRRIEIEGVEKLNPVDYTVKCDRLDAGYFMMASAMTRGEISMVGANLDEMKILSAKLEQMGGTIRQDGQIARVVGPNRLKPINIVTCPFPGFSTDYLPGMMALSTVATGTSYIRERIFSSRFSQATGLKEMGANIAIASDDLAVVEGVDNLHGAELTIPDLRAGMAYLLAGCAAVGETKLKNVYQLNRGYAQIVERFRGLGAHISYE